MRRLSGLAALMLAGCLLAVDAAAAPVPAPAAPAADAAARTRQDRYMAFLREKGYTPEINQKGLILFRDVDFRYCIDAAAANDGSLVLMLPAVMEVRDEAGRARVRLAMDEANAGVRAAKLFLVGDQVWAVIEVFLPRPDDFPLVFDRAQQSIASLAYLFADRLRAATPPAAP